MVGATLSLLQLTNCRIRLIVSLLNYTYRLSQQLELTTVSDEINYTFIFALNKMFGLIRLTLDVTVNLSSLTLSGRLSEETVLVKRHWYIIFARCTN